MLLRNIDGHIAQTSLQRLDQDANLPARAAAIFDQEAPLAKKRCDLAGVSLENRNLGSRRVILVELANPVEEFRASLVVEVFWRDALLRLRKPFEDFPLEVLNFGMVIVEFDLARFFHGEGPGGRANPMPAESR